MPNPLPDSTATSKGLRKFAYVLYLADQDSAATYPAYKLGNVEPDEPWVRQGRLRGNAITYNPGDPTYLEGRAGWQNDLQWIVVSQSEDLRITCPMDENDPDVIAKLAGTTATSLSSGAYTGQEYVYKAGTFYNAEVLLVGIGLHDDREEHLYAGKAIVTFKPTTQDTHNGLDVDIRILDTSSTETFRYRQWD